MKIHLIVGLIKKKSKGKVKIYRIFKYFTTSTGSDQILAQNLKGCQKKVLNFPNKSYNVLAQKPTYIIYDMTKY